MLSTPEAAEVAGVTVAAVKAWIAQGRVVALESRHGHRLPKWQFTPAIWAALPQLAEAMGTREPWRLLSFLESPLGGLAGLTPRQSIEQGAVQHVLELAAEEA